MAASRAALSRERVAKRPQSLVRRVGRIFRNFTIVLESVIFFIIASHLVHLSAPSTNPQPFNIHDESAAVTLIC
jgi:hypothetical protein